MVRRGGLHGRPEPGSDSRRSPLVPFVGADAHIGPPAAGCKAVCRPHCPPSLPHARFAAGLWETAPAPGRICNPPLQTRFRFPRRGGLHGRPEPGSDSRRGSMVPLRCLRPALVQPTRRLGTFVIFHRPFPVYGEFAGGEEGGMFALAAHRL